MPVFNKEQKLKVEKRCSYTLSFTQSTRHWYFVFFLGKNGILSKNLSCKYIENNYLKTYQLDTKFQTMVYQYS